MTDTERKPAENARAARTEALTRISEGHGPPLSGDIGTAQVFALLAIAEEVRALRELVAGGWTGTMREVTS